MKSTIREYIKANLFSGDEGGDVTMSVHDLLDELSELMEEWMQENDSGVVEAALAADREAALRDVFAAAALGGYMVRSDYWENTEYASQRAYKYADAMLKARKS